MDPNLVLSDEQKKARFRKMIEKKSPTPAATTTSHSPSATQHSNANHETFLPRSEPKSHTTEQRFGGPIRSRKFSGNKVITSRRTEKHRSSSEIATSKITTFLWTIL